MSSKALTVAVAIGLLVLFIALVMPALISAPNDPATSTKELQETETAEISNDLLVTLDAVDQGQSEVDVTIVDAETNQSANVTIAENETETVQLRDENISITADSIVDASSAILTTEYPSTYGWDAGVTVIAKNFDLILSIVSLIIVVGMLMAVVRV